MKKYFSRALILILVISCFFAGNLFINQKNMLYAEDEVIVAPNFEGVEGNWQDETSSEEGNLETYASAPTTISSASLLADFAKAVNSGNTY
ncbi:MAG: hypothetical protein IKA31_02465, partial [Clostridia bacterium]|nr:hypothetical protein [Clostridia bacterium]